MCARARAFARVLAHKTPSLDLFLSESHNLCGDKRVVTQGLCLGY